MLIVQVNLFHSTLCNIALKLTVPFNHHNHSPKASGGISCNDYVRIMALFGFKIWIKFFGHAAFTISFEACSEPYNTCFHHDVEARGGHSVDDSEKIVTLFGRRNLV